MVYLSLFTIDNRNARFTVTLKGTSIDKWRHGAFPARVV